jgi:quaternary ammonium compound-resistance protein SugE
MAWIYLMLAGVFEIVLAVGLKQSEGFTRLLPSAITTFGVITSMWFLALAVKTLPIGTAYAVWTAIGTIGTVIFGIVWLGEPAGAIRLALVSVILVAIAGLYLTSPQ